MIWAKSLYCGENIAGKKVKYKFRVSHNVLCPDLYLLCVPSNRSNVLDIIPQKELLQKAYPKRKLAIVGMAKGYGEALELVSELCAKVLEETGRLDMRDYFFGERS